MHAVLPCLILITGASGCGKTTFLEGLSRVLPKEHVLINYFDSVGVPSVEEMVARYGSCEKWQEATTHAWIDRLAKDIDSKVVILEGSFNPVFAVEHLKKLGIRSYKLICLHVDRAIRDKRLIELRKQPELATDDMERFAQFLNNKTRELGGIVVDSGVEFTDAYVTDLAKTLGF